MKNFKIYFFSFLFFAFSLSFYTLKNQQISFVETEKMININEVEEDFVFFEFSVIKEISSEFFICTKVAIDKSLGYESPFLEIFPPPPRV